MGWALAASGPVLVRVRARRARRASRLDGVGQDERLAIEVDLTGETSRLEGAAVEFEIAATADGRAARSGRDVARASQRHDARPGVRRHAHPSSRPPTSSGPGPIRQRIARGRGAFSVTAVPRVVAATARPRRRSTATPCRGRSGAAGSRRAAVRARRRPRPGGPRRVLDRVAAAADASCQACASWSSRRRRQGLDGLAALDTGGDGTIGRISESGLSLLPTRSSSRRRGVPQ